MELSEKSVAAYKELVTNPSAHGLSFRPIQDCFEKSDTVTAKHILAEKYIENEATRLHKLFCYIIMDEVFGLCDGKDENGCLGYHLKYVERNGVDQGGQ